jgi:hypothetical protein
MDWDEIDVTPWTPSLEIKIILMIILQLFLKKLRLCCRNYKAKLLYINVSMSQRLS